MPIQVRNIAVIAVAQPAAGAEISHTVPTGKVWRVLSLTALLTTSAGVANRESLANFGGNGQYPTGTTHVASQARVITWSRYNGVRGVGSVHLALNVPIGDAVVLGGSTITTSTAAIQVGDQYSNISLVVEELG